MHPDIENLNFSFNHDLINVTSYPDVYELLTICDILITDFSGLAYSMGYVKKPVFLFAKDWDNYLNNDRGQYIKQNQIPFSFSKNENELIQNINNFDDSKYSTELDKFYNLIGMSDSGDGAKKIVSILIKKLNS